MIIKGILIRAKRETKTFKGIERGERLYITVAEVELTDEQMNELKEAFKNNGKNFTPAYVKEFKGYINLSTKYELPCLTPNNVESSLETELDKGFNAMGAECEVSVKIKEGAIYPLAIKFLTEGEPYNPFSEFEEE